MANPTIKIHNLETDEIIEREMNAEEMKQAEADKAKDDAIKNKELQSAIDKSALLAKLGITADEAKLLLG